MSRLSKLHRRKNMLKEKQKNITATFQVCREAMKANLITPSQRQIIRDILRPVLHDLEGEVRDVLCHIQEELEKLNQENT
ncbi:hypothetical protein X824_gp250 [Escherichia phage 4MG]|uniref:Hyphothetical protein n=1 Tax=Escherichia phage 4MG TaxID=1391428 RepID=V5KSV5_9CAUD|nr:hypothetical protein X824_gp250 [Escherichia phage 4MG]AGZ17573.1 hyphothetical protein [Escherichia phage 4MG]